VTHSNDAPYVVVVSGLPATGKSTLSKRLGRDLSIPVISRDAIFAAVFADIDIPDAPTIVPAAITRVINHTLGAILATGGGVVLDGNFNTPQHADGLADMLAVHDARSIEICVWGDPDVLTARFAERADPPLDDELRPYFEEVLHRPRRPALENATRVLEFDTTEFDALEAGYADLLDVVRRVASGA